VVAVGSEIIVNVIKRLEGNEFLAEIRSESPLLSLLPKLGMMPIPPYIRKGISDAADGKDYQTPFGTIEGSVAAPTASLHFTTELMDKIRAQGCKVLNCTLHLSQASFLPLWREDGDEVHPPASELLSYSKETRSTILDHRRNGGRVIAVGTSMVRALETIARLSGPAPGEGSFIETNLFIQPGHVFEWADSVVTNFHQPRTTHLALVQALMGRKLLTESYAYAMSHDFRFLSYGDGMLVI
jgi:S-adenosylmethionine:tRNA ribosyltransferase-isomerase